MSGLGLWFTYSGSGIELDKTVFQYQGMDSEIVAVRGKTAGPNRDTGTFQWTPAVKALCVLFMRALTKELRGETISGPLVMGGKGTIAASLDYALDKEPQWVCDMFGLDKHGRSLLRRLILRTNPGQKRNGPVCLGLNTNALDTKELKLFVDYSPIQDPTALERLTAALLEKYEDGKDTAAEIRELFILRNVLEQAVAEELVVKVTDEDIEGLQALLSEMDSLCGSVDSAVFLKLDIEFHERLADIAGFTLAPAIYRAAREKFHLVGSKAITHKQLLSTVQQEHWAIVSAIGSRDKEAAKEAVKRHIKETQARYERFVFQDAGLKPGVPVLAGCVV